MVSLWDVCFAGLKSILSNQLRIDVLLNKFSFGKIDNGFVEISKFFDLLDAIDDGNKLVLEFYIDSIKEKNHNILVVLDDLKGLLKEISGSSEMKRDFVGNIFNSDTSNFLIEKLKKISDEILSAQRAILVDLVVINNYLFSRIHGDFLSAKERVSQILADVEKTNESFNRHSADAFKSIRNNKDNIEEAGKKARNIISLANSVIGAKAEIEVRLGYFKNLQEQSEKFKNDISLQSKNFDKLEKELRNDLNSSVEKNKKREEEVDELIAKANSMISGATTVGLSKSLEDAKIEYEKKMVSSRGCFIRAVIFLLASAISVVLLPFFGIKSLDGIQGIFGRIFLLLPGVWATAFFAKNYAEFFHLSREYAHKASLAKSIDGFKREAPKYQEEMAASLFVEIKENPGTRKSPSPASPRIPLFEKILETISTKKIDN